MLDPNQIYFARQKLSLSQRELASRANVSRTALNQFEQGKYVPGANFSRKLLDFFETENVDISVRANNPIEVTPSIPKQDSVAPLGIPEEVETSNSEKVTEADDDVLGAWMMALTIGLSLILGQNISR